MGSGLRILTIREIAIKLHPSFLLALAWVIYYWGIDAGDGLRGALFGIFLLIAVFVCVVGHELAHSFTALRYGLTVHDITLLPIGGVARIEQAPIAPTKEAAIACAGPLLNIVILLGLTPFLVGVLMWRHLGHPLGFVAAIQETGATALLAHLWLANLMLALFNLLPAFPMDGGRVVRAALSSFSSRSRATRIAVVLGQVLALGLAFAGIYTRDLMLPLVAIFIVTAATVEARMIQLETTLRSLPVGQFAVWDMGGVSPDSPLAYALRGGSRDVAVTEDGIVLGMLWRDEVLGHVGQRGSLRVRDVMDVDVAAMSVDDSVFDVHRRMLASRRPAIPITERGVYRGIFTVDRLVHVHRYLQTRAGSRVRYREIAEALGFVGR